MSELTPEKLATYDEWKTNTDDVLDVFIVGMKALIKTQGKEQGTAIMALILVLKENQTHGFGSALLLNALQRLAMCDGETKNG